MTKKEALKKTRTIFWLQAATAIALIILFETNFIRFSISGTYSYITDVAGIMLTLLIIPVAIKGFTAQMNKAVRKKIPHLIEYYYTRSSARCSLIFFVIIANIVLYYSGNTNALYCGMFGVAAAIYSYPIEDAIDNYLQKQEEE